MAADTGPIGGDLSHEFIILAETGESAVFCDRDFIEFDALSDRDRLWRRRGCEPGGRRTAPRSTPRTDEKHDAGAVRGPGARGPALCRRAASRSAISSISAPSIPSRWAPWSPRPDGEQVPVQMGSYGIGVSRLVGAIIEASHDEAGIIWPEAVAPFQVGLINLKADDAADQRLRGALRQAQRRRRRGALRRPRRAAGRQVRRDGSDRPALAAHRRPARRRRGQGRAEAPRDRRDARSSPLEPALDKLTA